MRALFVIPWHSSAYEAEQLLHTLNNVVVAHPHERYELIAPPLYQMQAPAQCVFRPLPKWVHVLPFSWGWSLFYFFIAKGETKIISAASIATQRLQQNVSPQLAACYATTTVAGPDLYFFVWCQPGNSDALLFLLKAFSLFKKRQQSSMQLVIPASIIASISPTSIDWETYKFREAIVWAPLPSIEAICQAEAKAYACIGLDEQGNASWWLQKAAQLRVPLLLSDKVSLDNDIQKNAVIQFSSTSIQDLADKMMVIYKDEELRKQLIKAGRAAIHH